MSLKLVVFSFILAVITIEVTQGAPRRNQDLSKSFVEFLEQDKQFAALLDQGNFGAAPALARHVRQAEETEFPEGEQDLGDAPPNKEGFFDRAAKFVMEVLQRFLKWVNADN